MPRPPRRRSMRDRSIPSYRAEALEVRLLLATVTGTKYHDSDGDGVYDGRIDRPLEGWTIYRDSNNNGVLDTDELSDVTDAAGDYSISFPVIFPGVVTIREVLQPGWRATNPSDGSHSLFFNSNGQTQDADFLNTQRAKVSGTVWDDLDADGFHDLAERGLDGWTIFADANDDGVLNGSEASTVSDASGAFVLNPNAGTYKLRQVAQSGWRTTNPSSGFHSLTLSAGQVVANRNFLNTRRALIAGTKFLDSDGDGLRGAAEPGLAGWTIYLDDNDNHVLDSGELSEATDASGNYSLTPLPDSNFDVFRIREVDQAGWRHTRPQSGMYLKIIGPGGVSTGLDFGNARPARVEGNVYHDLDVDGMREVGEPGLGGRIVYSDADNDGVFDDGIPRSFFEDSPRNTSHGGIVTSGLSVSDLPPMIAEVEVTLSFTHTTIGDLSVWLLSPYGTRIELFSNIGGDSDDIVSLTLDDDAGTSIVNATPPIFLDDYRPEQPLSTFDGQNPNGAWILEVADSNPSADLGTLDRWSLRVTAAEYSDATSLSGTYIMANLPPGEHHLRVKLEGDWRRTEPATGEHLVSLASNQNVEPLNFGLVTPGSISGMLFHDRNGDGIKGAVEEPLPGWTVYRDVNNDGQLDTHQITLDWTGIPMPLHDASQFSGVSIPSINFSVPFIWPQGLDGLLVDIEVQVEILHLRTSDLQIDLIQPDGSVTLFSRHGGNGALLSGTVFDDQAETAIEDGAAPFTGSFRPVQPLSGLDGIDPNAPWALVIWDFAVGPNAPGDPGGYLLDWTIHLTYGDPRRITGADGRYSFPRVHAGRTEHVRPVLQPGWLASAPPGGVYDLFMNSDQDHVARDFAVHDPIPPTVTDSQFLFETAPQRIALTFSEDIGATLTIDDIEVRNLQTNALVSISNLAYDAPTRTATASFAAPLPDGNYRVTLPAGSVQDAVGNPLAADYTFDFFTLAGDANRDRVVDISDLGILATNWQGTGKVFSEGDFSYDGTVDITDLGMLATNWQKQQPSLMGPHAPRFALFGASRGRRTIIEMLATPEEGISPPRR